MAMRSWVVWSGVLSRVDASPSTSSVRARIKLVGDVKVAPGMKRISDTPANQVGRPIDLRMTPDEADALADELRRAAAEARAGAAPVPAPVNTSADIRDRTRWRYGDWDKQVIPPTTKDPSPESLARTAELDAIGARAMAGTDQVPL